MNTKTIIAGAIAVLVLCLGIFLGERKIKRLTDERDRYKWNTETLLSDVEHYRVRDSLNAARVQSLELTVKEYERFRSEDAELIRSLKAKNRELAAVNKTQFETIIELSGIPRDTVVIVRDSVQVPAVSVHCGDAWFDFDGIVTPEQFTGTLTNRDYIVCAETVKYKRFLGFLWKTKRVKDRQMDCVSRNPHTTIVGMEHIIIEQ